LEQVVGGLSRMWWMIRKGDMPELIHCHVKSVP
jgi:hypothetical protein